MIERPMGVKEVAGMLGLSKNWIYWLANSGRLPHFRPTGPRGKILFFESGIRKFLSQRAVNNPSDLKRVAAL